MRELAINCGALDLVLQAMRTHTFNEVVQLHGCAMLSSMSGMDSRMILDTYCRSAGEKAELILAKDGLSVIFEALRRYEYPEVIVDASAALWNIVYYATMRDGMISCNIITY